jgi:hypothetical protein
MVKLTIVYTARDDCYGDDYNVVEFPSSNKRHSTDFKNNFVIKYNNIQRIKTAVENNILLLDKYFTNNYEIIFIDWNPLNNKFLYLNDELQNIFNKEQVKSIIVSNETVQSKELNHKGFYEYWGKNVGIRNSLGDFILISNPDDLLSEEIVIEMQNKLVDNNSYYRCEWRLDVDHNLKEIERGASFPKNGITVDEIMGGPASGDFTLTSKKTLFDIQGYPEHISNGNEASSDGALIVKMYTNNIKPVCLNGNILHLDHKKHSRSGGTVTHTYTNSDNWGFNDYNMIKIKNNVYKI